MNSRNVRNNRGVYSHAIHNTDFRNHFSSYLKAQGWGGRLSAYQKMRTFKSLPAFMRSTEAAIELAATTENEGAKQDLVGEAIELSGKMKIAANLEPPHNPVKLASLILGPNVPLLLNVRAFQCMPSIVSLEKAFDAHHTAITDAHAEIESSPIPAHCSKPELEGMFAQSFILLSLQRYALRNYRDMSWLPIPAIAHEESKRGNGSTLEPTWDISVFTEADMLDPTYCVQVKRSFSDCAYQEGIDMIYVRQQLAFNSERGRDRQPYVAIPKLLSEITPGSIKYDEQRWDARTEKIIDILG